MSVNFSRRWLVILLVCVFGLPDAAAAADAHIGLQASMFYELVADRARMLQVSLVIVALGCALLWWRR
jgi:hypothetical protein